MILDQNQFMETLREYVGEDNSEQGVQFVENLTDTFNDLNTRLQGSEDMVPRTELQRVNDEWAKKYRERFFEGTLVPPSTNKNNEEEEEEEKPLTFDNLFKEGC